ncbi:TetR/AcrR family transcriptional regulator [Actinocrispum wychmicini]|uniref:TetR family transcriptional regulator n=1 Tax=Actinocrispum wychmicini TaxID=1213861 RepID=A0A4V2S852_9PSEU|nr:TetR/AcrR family transcriptional regulator [Actinocrispum wychmicini]TCO62440.1 TetR family transcriptional regulator [Actinocrispum wychmicini]
MSSLGRIQRTAVGLFAVRGFAATGIREISRGANLNSATLYHYAGGKEELLATIMRACLTELVRAGTDAVEATGDPAVQLVRLVRAHVAVEAINPLTARVTDREVHSLTGANHVEIMRLRDQYEGLFRDVLGLGAAVGEFQLTDPRITRLALIEMCNGVANWYSPDGPLAVPDLAARFAELAGRMVGSRQVTADEYAPDIEVPRLESEPSHEEVPA